MEIIIKEKDFDNKNGSPYRASGIHEMKYIAMLTNQDVSNAIREYVLKELGKKFDVDPDCFEAEVEEIRFKDEAWVSAIIIPNVDGTSSSLDVKVCIRRFM